MYVFFLNGLTSVTMGCWVEIDQQKYQFYLGLFKTLLQRQTQIPSSNLLM